MAITENQFKQAFREAVSSEFSHIPSDENAIDIVLSERFTRKMEKLINAQKKSYYAFVNTAAKRAAIVFAILLTMLTTACSVKTIREPILNFIKEVYETLTHFSVDGDTVEVITKEYYPTYIPAGYTQVDRMKSDAYIVTTYKNDADEYIDFKQMTSETTVGYFIDNETQILTIEDSNGLEIYYKERNNTKFALWNNHGYTFEINCFGDNIDLKIIQNIISSVE